MRIEIRHFGFYMLITGAFLDILPVSFLSFLTSSHFPCTSNFPFLIFYGILQIYGKESRPRDEIERDWARKFIHGVHNMKMLPNVGDFPRINREKPDDAEYKRWMIQNKDWEALKREALHEHSLPNVQFVKMSGIDFEDSRRSLAVLQPAHTEGRVHTGLLSLAAAVMLVVVLVICIHAPCTCLWRRRHRSELEVDLISCPNPTAHDGKCGKCLYDKVTRKRASKFGFSKRPFSSPASIATINKEELYMPYDSQSPWVTSSNKSQSSTLPNPKKSRSIVQAILKRSRDRDKFRYEFLASRYGYNYKQFRDSYKRSSVYDEQDPNWYSAGEFLNTQSNRGQKNYGSTDGGSGTCCEWSRGKQQPTNQSVEDIIKLQPRRRQIVELQEFPVGYTETYPGIEGVARDNLLFEPFHDNPPCCHGSTLRMGADPSTMNSYLSQLENNNLVTDLEKAYSAQPKPTNIVPDLPSQTDPCLETKEGEKKKRKSAKKDWEEDEDSDLYETSSDDLLSFDEWDAALERRQRRSQEFLYSPHMQDARQQCHHLHHSYPAVLRYPDAPRDTRSLPREYKTRMRRHAARSEIELRRSSGYFGQSGHVSAQDTACHSSSDTSLHRMQIEKELAAAGLKSKQRKKSKEPAVRIRDNRLDPLAGIMSPVRPLKDANKQNKKQGDRTDCKQEKNIANSKSKDTCKQPDDVTDLKSRDKWENDLKVCLKDMDSYVVKLPSLDCKESVLLEHDDEISLSKGNQEFYKENLDKKLNNEKPDPQQNRVHLELDPHYIKNSYLREEPVRDTDSDDGERITRPEITTGSPKHASVIREENFSSNRSTRL